MSPRSIVLALLMVTVSFGALLRLFTIQVGEGDVWAAEAARLVRSGAVLPYKRGAILDASGRVLAHDEATYRLELSYRDFRRRHLLGQVAHARSALERRAVPLGEALYELERWALELGDLSPTDLDAFARGASLETPTFRARVEVDPDRTLRGQRASHLRYYIARLCGFTPAEQRRLRDVEANAERLPSYLTLLASWREVPTAELRRQLRVRIAGSRRHLELLAERIVPTDEDVQLGTPPLVRLVDDLEQVRRAVEELVASALFREAAGFAPGRIDPRTLYDTVDLSWIARPLFWDDDRLEAWCEETRERWRRWRDHFAVPHLLAEFVLRGESQRTVDGFLDLLATVYAEPATFDAALAGAWTVGPRTAVFGRLDPVFGLDDAPDFRLPREAFEVRPGTPAERAPWRVFEELARGVDTTDDRGRLDKQKAWRVRQLTRALDSPRLLTRYDLEILAQEIVPDWEAAYQDELARVLRDAVTGDRRAGFLRERIAPNGRLRLTSERREIALESFRDHLRDYGDRSIGLDPRPSYEVVYLLTRFPEEYHGFRAVDTRLRVRPELPYLGAPGAVDADSAPRSTELAAAVIGNVSAIGIDQLLRQRRDERRLAELRGRIRSDEEDDELAQLVGEVLLRSEVRGVSGIEGEWDDVLRGRNGYREHRGLEDVYGRGRVSAELSRRVDGEPVQLTLDARLQADVEWMLEYPSYDPSDVKVDREWFENPVGAIVLVAASGEVVVSASVPNAVTAIRNEGAFAAPGGRPDRSVWIDRTLRKPAFQPPGSVFKPFVAAWALDRLGLDPATTVECRRDGGPPNYRNVRCWNTSGHGSVDLAAAIRGSCNCYFAWLGEQFGMAQVLREMAVAFGFGTPTGLRREGSGAGLLEAYVPDLFMRRLSQRELCLAGNGLAVVEATPMQVARATLALATGELRALSNVRAVGGEPVEPLPPLPVPVSEANLERVREAMFAVANDPAGTAYNALNPEELGLEVVVKTGSADLQSRSVAEQASAALKHTWVAGWLPREDPRAVFVVFLDQARATSSHTAVYVARQLLQLPSVREWLAREGVPLR